MAMLLENYKQSALQLIRDGESFFRGADDNANADKVHQILTDAESGDSPTIMFYGLYNAGKSTLINALCQEYVAKTGDVPTTAAIQPVPWEGYSLVDTPGINAQDAHTTLAVGQINESDLILFVMDNSDTFDNAFVYQAIVKIVQSGKALAVVVNQKNIDEDEDPNISVPEQPSMVKILDKITVNLAEQGQRSGIRIEQQKNFLGRFAVNAQTAFDAHECEAQDRDLLIGVSGISPLVTAIHEVMRHSAPVYRLQTPLIALREILRDAAQSYEDTTLYGNKQQLAEMRDELLLSRQRLRDSLLVNGLRKIDATMEMVKAAALDGKPVSNISEELKQELNQLFQDAAARENAVLSETLHLDSLPAGTGMDATSVSVDNVNSEGDMTAALTAASSAGLAMTGLGLEVILPTLTFTIPLAAIPVIIGVIVKLVDIISGKNKEDMERMDTARRDAERMKAYYKFLNELRDSEARIKATWDRAVNEALEKFYGPKIAQLDKELANVSSECAAHIRNLEQLGELRGRLDDEMRKLETFA